MRRPLTEGEKQYIVRRKELGATLREIARELHCSIWTTGKWWRNHKKGEKPRKRGRPRQGTLSTYPAKVRMEAKRLKEQHPHWGPAMVKTVLREQLGEAVQLPSDSQMALYFKEVCPEAVQKRQRQQYPEKAPPPVVRPHERWQIDAQEGIAFGDQRYATILNIRDPLGALMIASQAFETTTEKRWRKLTLEEVKDSMREAFSTWGLPLEIQTDREIVYIGHPEQQFPSYFTLWLVGLGIRHVLSRSRRPTDQGAEERNHRTIDDMALNDQYFDDIPSMQQVLDRTRQRYNHAYPAKAGLCEHEPPLEKHPWAHHSGRPFHPDAEWNLFHMEWVDDYLAQQTWTRQANDNSQVSLNHCVYYLGKDYRNQTVSITFNPHNRHFVFCTQDGDFIKELPVQKLDKADIIGRIPVTLMPSEPIQLPLPFKLV